MSSSDGWRARFAAFEPRIQGSPRHPEAVHQEERLRLLARVTGLAVLDIDFAGGRVWWNDEYQAWFGPLPEGFHAFPGWWIERLHPEDREAAASLEAALAGDAETWTCAYRFRTGEGSYAAFLDRAAIARGSLGEPRRIVCGITRASGRDSILDSLPVALFVSRDPGARLVLGNRTARELFRVPPGGNLSGASAAETPAFPRAESNGAAVPPADMPVPLAARTGRPVRDHEFDLVYADGSRRSLLGSAVPLFTSSGAPAGAAGAFLDITEHNRFEVQSREAYRNAGVGILAGGLAHQLNNLLLGVMGNASLAQDLLPAGHAVAELLKGVVDAGQSAAHLTGQMLAYSGKGRFMMERTNLPEVIDKALTAVLRTTPAQIAVGHEPAPSLPFIQADRGQLQQLIDSLLVNAVEAIGSTYGSVTIATGVRDMAAPFSPGAAGGADLPAGRYVSLEVRDTGCGMDAVTMARIFDPFFSTRFTGRGMGLSAAVGIVRGHRGAIYVTSAPGQGSSFAVLLPALESAEPPAETPAEELRGTGTILLVDDEEMVRKVARKSLEWWGYEVLAADSGLAAIELFRESADRIALVVLDFSMPGMSGLETVPELRRIRPDVKVLICSGHAEAVTSRVFADVPLAGVLHKPYTNRQLARVVKSILAAPNAV